MTFATETTTETTQTVVEAWDGEKWVNESRTSVTVTRTYPAREQAGPYTARWAGDQG